MPYGSEFARLAPTALNEIGELVDLAKLARPAFAGAQEAAPAVARAIEALSPQLETRLATIGTELKNLPSNLATTSEYIEFTELPGSAGFPKVTNSILGAGKLEGPGIEIANAEIDPYFKIAGNTKIRGLEHLPVRIGESFEAAGGVEIGPGSVIGGTMNIGKGSKLAGMSTFGEGVSIGDGVSIGPRSQILDRSWIADGAEIGSKAKIFQDAFVGGKLARGVTVGANAEIESGVKIGRNADIGTFVKIGESSFIGPDAKIGGGTKIFKSHIGQNAIVGPRSNITFSRVRQGVRIQDKSNLRDSNAWD